jgi:hypothetical protein
MAQLDKAKKWFSIPRRCFKCGHLGHICSHCYIQKSYQQVQFKACLWVVPSTSTPALTYPLSSIHSIIIPVDIVWCALLANCLLFPAYVTDTPIHHWLHKSLFLSDTYPHYLMIIFSTCTICVCLLFDVWISRYSLSVPPTIMPHSSLCHLIRQF